MGFFKRFTRPRAKLWLTAEKKELTFAEELKGIIGVKAEEEFDIEEVTVELNCWESVKETVGYRRIETRKRKSTGEELEMEPPYYEKEEDWNYKRLYSQRLQLCKEMHVNIGFSKEFPFVIKMPTAGRETFHSIDRNLQWLVKAIMSIKGRRSIKTQNQEILVSKPLQPSKEIVREVVLIPCAYCGGLMPQTSTFCPNCGARRN